MIGKINTGAEFTGLIDYLLDPSKTPQILTTNLNGTSRNQLLSELEYCAAQRPTTKKPVKHLMIAFAPADGKIDDPIAEEIALVAIKKLGYANNQYLIVRHGRIDPNHDRTHDHDHVHILVNAINFDGKRVSSSHELYKLKDILQELEVQYDLTRTVSFDRRKYKSPTTGQVQRIIREVEEYQSGKRQEKPQAPYMSKIQSGIDLASHDKPTLTVFLARLQQLGIEPKFRIEENKVEGISYKMQGFKVRGCKLHQASLPKLLEHRVILDEERDLVTIALVNAGEKLELAPELEVSWSQTRIRNYFPKKIQNMLQETFGENKLEVVSKSQPKKTVDLQPKPENSQDKGWEIDF